MGPPTVRRNGRSEMSRTPPRFGVGDYVQRVNQPEQAGIVRELRWDGQVESWNYLVQFGAQLRAVPEEALEVVSIVQSPWGAFELSICLLYTSPSPRDGLLSRMPSSA